MSQSITIDTCVWLKLLDKRDLYLSKDIEALLTYCLIQNIQIYYSSRVLNFDTTAMSQEQQQHLIELLNKYKAKIQSSSFRLGGIDDPQKGSGLSSYFDPPDKQGDFFVSEIKSDDELQFEDVFGLEPSQLPREQTGKKLSNHIGDYDALKFHFLNAGDIFVTYDTKLYMSETKRNEAKAKLNLIILDPISALAELKNT